MTTKTKLKLQQHKIVKLQAYFYLSKILCIDYGSQNLLIFQQILDDFTSSAGLIETTVAGNLKDCQIKK